MKCLDTGTVLEMEDSYIVPKGTIWMRGTYTPLRDADGRISRIVIVTHDITELKQREIAEQQHREIIAQQSTAIAELSTPLLTISDKTVVMPLIGAVDSRRVHMIMETLLSGWCRCHRFRPTLSPAAPLRRAGRIGDRLPLLAGRKACAAAPGQFAGRTCAITSAGVMCVTARINPS